jgi:NADPH:quinone reductase-like Zn-dependent oxidoreductase
MIIGCDYSGVVVEKTLSTRTGKVGDQIAGMVHGGKFTDKGPFAGAFWVPLSVWTGTDE